MVPLAERFWALVLGVTGAEVFRALLHQTGAQRPDETEDEPDMSDEYEIVGDDLMGAIGEDLLVGDELEDIFGADDDEDYLEQLAISGAGDTEIIGAPETVKQAKRKKRARQRAMLRRLVRRNAGAVVNRGLDRRRRYPLGFVPTSITAGTSTQIPSAPQNLYRPERLVIPSDIAFDAGVRDIKVGNTSQLVQSVEVPAAVFSEVAINTGVTFDTAEVGNQVSVDIRNKSGSTFEFSAALVGTIAK